MKRLIIRGKSNCGDKVKQYCFLAENKKKGYEKAIIIHRLILTDDVVSYSQTQHHVIRQFKDKYVMGKSFSLKVSTLETMLNWAKKKY